jgi:aromatic-L-amino-acid/L-tryptophan decarboxylase
MPLDMPAGEFRRHAHSLVDRVADLLEHPEDRRVFPAIKPGAVTAQLLDAELSATPFGELLSEFDRAILPALTHWNHPGFMAYFPTTGSYPGILAELLAASLNINAMLWRTGPAAVELEQIAADHLRRMLGLPEQLFAELTDTASTSTLYALAAARESAPELRIKEEGLSGRDLPSLRVYCSEEAHSSVDKAVATLGLGMNGVRRVATDAEMRMRPDALEDVIKEDRATGVRPLAVVATVGTTSTTAIDPVPEIAAVCGREHIWLHVDAAYGGAAAVVPEMRWVLRGCERADSLVINPHKWLFVPMDCSVLFTRRRNLLEKAFSLTPEYLAGSPAESLDPMNYGVALGRRFRALKLWFVLRYFGAAGLAELLRGHIALARELAAWIDDSDRFERLAPVHFSTVVFRATGANRGDDLNQRIMDAVNASGEVFLSHTRVRGQFALRAAIGNIRTTRGHVARAWELLTQAEAQLRASVKR